jgi:two-component system, chemotaxis family, sensor kinase CheA
MTSTDRHRQTYLDEARELLADLESSLLELEQRPEDHELISRAFRALHTIKGSGAMFGFDEVASFTHELETLFDAIRGGRVPVTKDLVGISLDARDHIQQLLWADGDEHTPDTGGLILERLRQAVAIDSSPAAGKHAPQAGQVGDLPHGELRAWRILFEPQPEIFMSGADPLPLLDELRALGECRVTAHLDRIPELDRFEPETCYTRWEIELTTAAGENAIRDVFIFVEDSAGIAIEAVPPVAAAPAGLASAPKKSEVASTLRVSASKLDDLVNIVGELVTVQARLSGYALAAATPEIQFIAEEIERLSERLRENTMSIRMLPIGDTFSRFNRLVRDLSAELGKKIEMVTEGGETELDKTVIEQLSDPLVHLVRNAVDHGIERPDRRLAAGKAETGRIHLSACHSGAFVLIRVTDDGAGMNRDVIRTRAIERGMIAADAVLTDQEIFGLVMQPGFSTSAQVTEISGRGVGMDVVQRSLDVLRGTLSVSSEPGRGTTVTLKIPLTLAIIDGLLVEAGGAFYVVPLSNISECIELRRNSTNVAHRGSLVNVRGELVPYVVLRERFALPGDPPKIEQVIVAETRGGKCGFVVDRVIGDHHTVIKKLGSLYRHVEEVSGATILGDGTVALILDVDKLAAELIRESRR